MTMAGANVPESSRQTARNAFPGEWLVCFAVKEEAKGFVAPDQSVRTLITGMGGLNAKRAIEAAINSRPPAVVLTCGFAGGLAPGLAKGTVLFSEDSDPQLQPFLSAAGLASARFLCANRVAVTAAEKRALRATTGADAVEMESQFICAFCRAKGIPSAAVRVILDPADEDLPLDFNQLMTPDQRMDFKKLALVVLKSPGKIRSLLRLQNESRTAARRLGLLLTKLLAR